MKEVSVCHALYNSIYVASVAKVPTPDGSKIIERTSPNFFLIFKVTRPYLIFEHFFNIEFGPIFDPPI